MSCLLKSLEVNYSSSIWFKERGLAVWTVVGVLVLYIYIYIYMCVCYYIRISYKGVFFLNVCVGVHVHDS